MKVRTMLPYACADCGRIMQIVELKVGIRRALFCDNRQCVNRGREVLEPEFEVEEVR